MKNPLSCHFVGIGGIGMSGLAAMYKAQGYHVSGSDRGADAPENAHIIKPLKAQGVVIYPQDGSFIKSEAPDFIVYSTAIEPDNPDFVAAPNIPKKHRAQALQQAIENNKFITSIAVSGSCGKSSVTAYLAETLMHLGEDVDCLNGALIKSFIRPDFAGNYRRGSGEFFVFEADESDKSLREYRPDYSIVLNIGTDHYQKSELAQVFADLVNNTHKAAVLSREVFELIKSRLNTNIELEIFETNIALEPTTTAVTEYHCPYATFSNRYQIKLPQPGFHTALNALAIFSMCRMLKYKCDDILTALQKFSGVCRRFDFHGLLNGAPVYDDYAHNPEKLLSCIRAAREVAPDGERYYIFQPHGYKPLGFMREPLLEMLRKNLTSHEHFCLLPVFYAGGSSSFTPQSEEVIASFSSADTQHNYKYFSDRKALADYLKASAKTGDAVIIMGARDNSLGNLAASLVNHK